MFNLYLNEIYCFHTEQSSTKFVLIWSYDTHMVIRYNPHKKYLLLRWGTMKQNREGWWWWWWGWGIMKQEQRWEIQLSFKTFFLSCNKKRFKTRTKFESSFAIMLGGKFQNIKLSMYDVNWIFHIILFLQKLVLCLEIFEIWKRFENNHILENST